MDNNGSESVFDGAEAITKMWGEFASRMAQASGALKPDDMPPEMARAMRSAMFRAMGEYCDQFMRSPQFLQMMKQSMAGAIQLRRQLNEFLGRVQHEFQGTSRQDVDQLMLALRHLEQRIVDGNEHLLERIEELDARLDALEAPKKSSPETTKRAAKKATPKTSGKRATTKPGKKPKPRRR